MSDATNKVISLDYKLFRDTESGEMIETTEGSNPMVFLTGVGQMIPDFENNVISKNAGESFSFAITSDKAYGDRTDEAIIDLPKSTFMHEGELIPDLKEGNTIALQDDQGMPFPSKVISIGEETVKMDMNHPLAGQNLYFTGTVIEVREATAEELEHGHVHGPGGHNH